LAIILALSTIFVRARQAMQNLRVGLLTAHPDHHWIRPTLRDTTVTRVLHAFRRGINQLLRLVGVGWSGGVWEGLLKDSTLYWGGWLIRAT